MIDNNAAIENKIILITGGTGSFGTCITRELLKFNPREIRIYSRDEEKQLDMQRSFSNAPIKFFLGDVRDFNRIRQACDQVDIVVHAAAQKIVPACEINVLESIKTNSLGSFNVKRAANECNVKKAVLISTDKAVKPINLYGMTKAVAEKIWVNESLYGSTIFSVVRYGNVVGSRGSVIPYFKSLIEQKKSLPITSSKMTRFLITLEQAVNLVFYALNAMGGGETFIPKIPACNVVDLAKVMGGENYTLDFVGVRPGEKIHECLIQEDEFRRTVEKENCYVLMPQGAYDSGKLLQEYTSENAYQLTSEEIRNLLIKTNWL